jgi:hypothetical protein
MDSDESVSGAVRKQLAVLALRSERIASTWSMRVVHMHGCRRIVRFKRRQRIVVLTNGERDLVKIVAMPLPEHVIELLIC